MFKILHIATSSLRPHERASRIRVEKLIIKIREEGLWTTPILIDRASKVILDGHHRHQAATLMGLRIVPCACTDYLSNDAISVTPRRKHIPVSKKQVIAQGLKDSPFPYKTTRHNLAVPLPELSIPLHKLKS